MGILKKRRDSFLPTYPLYNINKEKATQPLTTNLVLEFYESSSLSFGLSVFLSPKFKPPVHPRPRLKFMTRPSRIHPPSTILNLRRLGTPSHSPPPPDSMLAACGPLSSPKGRGKGWGSLRGRLKLSIDQGCRRPLHTNMIR